MPALKRIEFKRYKRLERFSLSCTQANILVGPNNAGKSSILDALRVMSGVQRHAKRLKPKLIRTRTGETWGYEVPDSAIPVNIANVVHNYGDEDAVIDFVHENGRTFSIELHPDRITRVYVDDAGKSISSGRAYFDRFPLAPIVVPTLSPFEIEEEWVTDETVDRNRGGRLASRHFRNTWYRSSAEEFQQFAEIIADTWPGVSIQKAARPFGPNHLEMFYREGLYEREISWSGFGFQVWMQIVSHMLRGSREAIFVLDEPDIYLHPDLQSKLLQLVRGRFDQFFLATHSPETINHSRPGDIVSINSRFKSAKRIRSDAEYNQVYTYIGSIENVELSKLSRAKRVIFFEGKDKKLLAKLSERAGLRNLAYDNETLVIGVGGYGQWKRVVEAAWTFRNVLQVEVKILAIFDRDYRDAREIADFTDRVMSEEVYCRVWQRKEMENYLLIPRSLRAAIIKRLRTKEIELTEKAIDQLLADVTEVQQHDVQGQLTGNALSYERSIGSKKDAGDIAAACSRDFGERWASLEGRFRLIAGKQFISDLSGKMQSQYGVSLTESMILEEIKKSDLDVELIETLMYIDQFCAPKAEFV